ncbi:hypothetical protein [Streptomyces rubiginosohelvolus]
MTTEAPHGPSQRHRPQRHRHEGLFNSYTGYLIDVACDANRYTAVEPYTQFDPTRLTEDPATCIGCRALHDSAQSAPRHPADIARQCAHAVLADADNRGCPPALDDEGLRLAFVRLAPDAGNRRQLFERLARGAYDPQNSYRTEPLYALTQEHLADTLTERAMEVPAGTPEVLIRYQRYTGGELQAPVGVGDRLTYDGLASGHWPTGTGYLLTSGARQTFRTAIAADDATWTRGRGWALSIALLELAHYRESNPVMARIAAHVIEEIVDEEVKPKGRMHGDAR